MFLSSVWCWAVVYGSFTSFTLYVYVFAKNSHPLPLEPSLQWWDKTTSVQLQDWNQNSELKDNKTLDTSWEEMQSKFSCDPLLI